MGERLEPRAELRRRPAHPLGDRAHPPVLAGQQGDDAVGLTQLVGAQHDRLVAVERHPPILPASWADAVTRRRGASASRPAAAARTRRRSRSSRSGQNRHSRMLRARTNVALGSSSASIAASAAGWIGSAGWPTTSAGAVMARRRLDERRDPAEEQPVHDRAPSSRRAGRGCRARSRPRTARRRAGSGGSPARSAVDGERQEPGGEHQRREGEDPGLDRVVEDRHLDDQPAHPLGRDVGDLERDVGAQRRAADDRLLGARGGRAAPPPARRTRSSSRPAGRRAGRSGRGRAGRG